MLVIYNDCCNNLPPMLCTALLLLAEKIECLLYSDNMEAEVSHDPTPVPIVSLCTALYVGASYVSVDFIVLLERGSYCVDYNKHTSCNVTVFNMQLAVWQPTSRDTPYIMLSTGA